MTACAPRWGRCELSGHTAQIPMRATTQSYLLVFRWNATAHAEVAHGPKARQLRHLLHPGQARLQRSSAFVLAVIAVVAAFGRRWHTPTALAARTATAAVAVGSRCTGHGGDPVRGRELIVQVVQGKRRRRALALRQRLADGGGVAGGGVHEFVAEQHGICDAGALEEAAAGQRHKAAGGNTAEAGVDHGDSLHRAFHDMKLGHIQLEQHMTATGECADKCEAQYCTATELHARTQL